MLEHTTIARPYARAVFEQAKEENDFDRWSGLLNILVIIVTDNRMKSLIDNPKVSDEMLFGIIQDICGNTLSNTGNNFVRILIDAGRLTVLPEILQLYHKMRVDSEGLAEVEVVSAYPLSDDQTRAISEAMTKRLGKKIDITARIDNSLIGGAVIRTGDSAIDASIRGRLRQLSNEFA